jgi:hypothetical protein
MQEKFIRFPTDARLNDRMRERLVTAAQQRDASAQQFRRARRMTQRFTHRWDVSCATSSARRRSAMFSASSILFLLAATATVST